MKTWKEIWKNRSLNDIEDTTLNHQALIKLNGFDAPSSHIPLSSLALWQEQLKRELRIDIADSVYEVGCGSGGFLYNLYKQGFHIGGCDISESLINYAKEALPKGKWEITSANNININRWDHVLSFSVFHYLTPSEAKETLLRMIMKAKHSVAILDINNAMKEEAFENHRSEIYENYAERYKDLKQTYYHKSWWIDILDSLGVNYRIYDQDIQNYEIGKFRYNIIILL